MVSRAKIVPMKNTDIAAVFGNIADLLELKGENKFKIRAYARAAEVIRHLPEEMDLMHEEGKDFKDVAGIGDAIAAKSMELITTGRLRFYEELKAQFPDGIINLMDIPGIGPKTAYRVATELGVGTVDQLEAAIRDGRLAALERMGEKTAANILHAIEVFRRKDRRIPLGEALPVVEEVISALKNVPGVRNLTAAGSLRRFKETVGDIDLMGTADDAESVIRAFATLPQVREVLSQGPTKASVILLKGLQADLRIVEHRDFGSLLQHFTGSKEHNVALRTRSQKQGLSLSEYGITDVNTGGIERFSDEESFYRYLGLQYIPPELREDMGEIALAERNALPALVEVGEIKGDFHAHTTGSDGIDTIETMAGAAEALGYEYLAITDHSSGRNIGTGKKLERVQNQTAEINRLNRSSNGLHLLNGMEVDIRADGSLDLPDEVLAGLDIVIASVHSSFLQSREVMTRRIIGAIENPNVDIIAHPTCRKIGEREPVDVDLEAVFNAALRCGKALEINAIPDRLDLKDLHAYRARELGVMLVIGTDAHAVSHLGFMKFGIGLARRAWCQPKDILNTRPLSEVLAYLRKR
ncbi:MAG: DNA polymerase/3'-5' exonuclease PolX [Chloroflexi bacterium]|nr:DNA polymerase/3'-5' exonuclease PolX [Chloroflexota bacterium]